MFAVTIDIDMQSATAYLAFRDFISSERVCVSRIFNPNNSNSNSGLFSIYDISNSLKEARTSDIVNEVSSSNDNITENAVIYKQEAKNAIKVLRNSKLAIDAAKMAFGIDISNNISTKSKAIVKDILCITHALRNIDTEDIMLTKPSEDELDFFYAFSEDRVMKLQSSFPRQQDDEVIVSFYKMGELLYMNNMPLKDLVNDLESYL